MPHGAGPDSPHAQSRGDMAAEPQPPPSPFEPYAKSLDHRLLCHLLRRAAVCVSPARIEQFAGQNASQAVATLTGYDPTKPMPLVLAFHGYLMASAEMRSTTHLDEAADKNGFIVGFPNGKNESWNGGDCCGDASSQKEDDVAVAKAIVASIDADYCVDAKRTFATGFSNGGFLAYRLACEAADVFAAVAPVSAVLGIDPKDCKPSRPVPVLEVHGTSDIVVPYKGGRSVFLGPEYRSVDTTMKAWATTDACSSTKTTVFQQGDVKCESFKPCGAGTDVELCTIDGGAHAWPGGSGSNGSSNASAPSRNVPGG